MYEELVARDGTVSLLATFAPSLPSMVAEIESCAQAKGTKVNLRPQLVEGALDALLAHRPDEHNGLIAQPWEPEWLRRHCARAVFDGAGESARCQAHVQADTDYTR